MATSPFGAFADLSSYRRAVDASKAAAGNPLDQLITGFTQGQAVRNLPQTLETQRQIQLENELTRRLNNAIALQKLQDLQNPQAALAREVQKSLAISSANPASGVVAMPAGLEGEVIAQPGALTVEQQLALDAGGAAPTVAPAGVPIRPVSLAGVPTGFGQDLTAAAAATEALSTAKGQSALERLILGNETRKAIAEAANASRERVATEGNKTKKEIQDMKGKTGSKGLTANAQQSILGKAAYEGIDLEDPKYRDEDGNYKITEINLESSKKRRERVDTEHQTKLAATGGKIGQKQKDELASVYLVQKELERFRDIITDPTKISGEPGVIQNALSVAAAQPSTGIWTSLYRQGAQLLLTDESKLKENVRSTITSAVNQAISGKVITKLEATQLGFTPKGDDTIAELIEKSNNLEIYLKDKEESILRSAGGSQAPSSSTVVSPSTSTAPKIIKITPRAQ